MALWSRDWNVIESVCVCVCVCVVRVCDSMCYFSRFSLILFLYFVECSELIRINLVKYCEPCYNLLSNQELEYCFLSLGT